ncbi:MAG TPA: 50S ribosomal protein L5 [Bacteroidia bacterium]|nr:50S ribosomal protein L5 [Bacteroidia bacterium]
MAKQEANKKQEGKAQDAEKKSAPSVAPKNYTPRLKAKYNSEIVSNLQKEFGFKSPMRVPRLKKIALNQGVGDAVSDRKVIESALNEMATITGQKPMATLSKKDISNFKVRKGVAIGVKVTLRSNNMYEFLDRFISTALPRIRDFKGISKKGFDGRGNYTLGITEQIIFPEINIDRVNKVRGMDITFVTSARTNNEAMSLLKEFGMPFKKEEDENKGGKSDMMNFGSVAKRDTKETKK